MAPLLSEGGTSPDKAARRAWLSGLFEGASKALTEGLDSLCSFIGIKVRMSTPGSQRCSHCSYLIFYRFLRRNAWRGWLHYVR